jgi:pyruvate kinase
MNERKTKIIAKIADNRCEPAFLESLFAAGADVAWLNTAHQGEAETIGVVKNIRSVSATMPIMIDTKGPEVRTKDVAAPIEVKPGDRVYFTGDASFKGKPGDKVVLVSYPKFHIDVPKGAFVLYDDASIETTVVEKLPKALVCQVKNGGMIKNKKSLNVPDVRIELPALTEKDKGFIHFCAKNDIDFIAHSFVRSKEDLFEIKKITDQYPNYKPKVIAKIENREGFENVREILKHCDGLMVARGDLGAEVRLEELPFMQKVMLEASLEMGKYCIVATQVLESMIKNPRPTRAEVSDVGNAVLDGTGAMSMSGETAYGDWPVEATSTMGRVMRYVENKRAELGRSVTLPKVAGATFKDAKAIVAKADKAGVSVIVTAGADVALLRAIAAYRPNAVVVAACTSEADVRELGMAYGIRPMLVAEADASHIIGEVSRHFAPKASALVVTKTGKAVKTTIQTLAAAGKAKAAPKKGRLAKA